VKFLCDEGVECQIPALLREKGHTVWYVAEMDPGISDIEVLRLCEEHEAVLVTSDKDFGELVFRRAEAHEGVVLLRLPGTPPESKARLLAGVIDKHGQRLPGSFTVLDPGRIRVRVPK
jgi:predicted nuclease of predicted toxin-antitoxin system